jgi:uncharacterized protein (DUF302 family)
MLIPGVARPTAWAMAAAGLMVWLAACSRGPAPVAEARFVEPDTLFRTVESNVRSHPEFEVIVDIDHARLAAEAGSPMPPSHVLIWSDPALEAAILETNPSAAVDLPLRVLAFEDPATGTAAVIANRFDFLANRHGLREDAAIRRRYDAAISKAVSGIPPESVASFASDTMDDAGLVTLDSPYDFGTTEAVLTEVISSQPDTVFFATVDFQARSEAHGVRLAPLRLLLCGGPGPGGRAMASAPTLGLDAFCQKLLIWQDATGRVRVTFNDLLALAERQQVAGGIPLRVVNRRIRQTFSEALDQ